MLKPEALEHLTKFPAFASTFYSKLFNALTILQLDTIAPFRDRFPINLFREIYAKEIALGVIPEWEVSRFSEQPTEHFIVKGDSALEKTFILKGKFVCEIADCPYNPLPFLLQDIYGFPRCNVPKKTWGDGCGIRGFLATLGILLPDEGETAYTVYNWIHCPDVDQQESVQRVIEFFRTYKHSIA